MAEKPDNLLKILESRFGFTSFRGEQEGVISSTLEGEDTLVLMPTGMGKSLCFQFPSEIFDGLTVVLSPLIALMKDQVDQAKARGFQAEFINSSLGKQERETRYKKLARGDYKILYVTPERFRKSDFLEAIGKNQVSLLAVDEAHCVSQWGHDFRPDYSRVDEIREILKFPTTMALTATATPEVQEDIIMQMGFQVGEVKVFDAGIERPNLSLNVHDVYGTEEKIRLFIGAHHQTPGCKVAYFSLISTLEIVSEEISRMGIEHTVYHGRLRDKDRKKNQERFLRGECELILATPAFGLGVDKPDIRSVIHFEMPGSLEAYYQEVGRAGRDGEASVCHLFFDQDDVSIQTDFIKWANPEPHFFMGVFDQIKTHPERVNQEGLEYLREKLNFYNKRDFRLETSLNLLERWGVIEGEFRKRNISVIEEIPKEYLDKSWVEGRLQRQREKLLTMVQWSGSGECLTNQIYEYFGRPLKEPCGKCSVCAKD